MDSEDEYDSNFDEAAFLAAVAQVESQQRDTPAPESAPAPEPASASVPARAAAQPPPAKRQKLDDAPARPAQAQQRQQSRPPPARQGGAQYRAIGSKNTVPANPFAHQSNGAAPQQPLQRQQQHQKHQQKAQQTRPGPPDDDEEDLAGWQVTVSDTGEYALNTGVSDAPSATRADSIAAQPRPPANGASRAPPGVASNGDSQRVSARPVASTSRSSPPPAQPRRPVPRAQQAGAAQGPELEALRQDKEQLQRELEELKNKYVEIEEKMMAQAGEISTVRRNREREGEEHLKQLEKVRKETTELQGLLQRKESEYKREVDTARSQAVWSRHEADIITMSARRRTVLPSRTPRGFADVGRAFSQQTWQSPSVGRSRLGSSQTPAALPQKQTAFPGFNNSFAVQSPSGPSQAVLRRQRGASQMPGFSQARSQRESSMGPPPLPRKLPRTTTPRQSQRQASQRMASQAPSPVRSQKGKQVERSSDAVDTPADALMSEDAMDDEAASQDGEPDSVNSILAALFNHQTETPFDGESCLPPTVLAAMPSAATSAFAATAVPSAATASTSNASAVTVSPAMPVPTLHALTNMRFGASITGEQIAQHEQICRDLFNSLGRVDQSSGVTGEEQEGVIEVATEIGRALQRFAKFFDAAGLVGPLTAIYSLIGALVHRFLAFTLVFLNHPTAMALQQLIKQRGADENAMDTSGSQDNVEGGARSRLLRTLGRSVAHYGNARITGTTAQADPSSTLGASAFSGRRLSKRPRKGQMPATAIELDAGLRDGLLSEIVNVLDGLAFNMDDKCEQEFAELLMQPDVVAVLMSPQLPLSLLNRVMQNFALIASRPVLYRPLMAAPFAEAQERKTVGLFDRIGQFFVRGQLQGSFEEVHKLELLLVTLLATLLMTNPDATTLVGSSESLLPEMLDKLSRDVDLVWSFDGVDVPDAMREQLRSVVTGISALLHTLHRIVCEPEVEDESQGEAHAVAIHDFMRRSRYQLVQDRFNVAMGTLAFAPAPDWAQSGEDDKSTRETLQTLARLAEEIISADDDNPEEAEEMARCFVDPDEFLKSMTLGDGDEVDAEMAQMAAD